MTDTGRDCPDCGVSMESMELKTREGYGLRFVSDERREGILGKLGARQTYGAETLVCPDCGLSRVYADLDEDGEVGQGGSESGPDEEAPADDEAEGWSFE